MLSTSQLLPDLTIDTVSRFSENFGVPPFFVVACDYTLIGEELYAAGAYLSKEPRLLGSLKGSDLMKALLILIIVVGCVLETAGYKGFTNFMATQ